MALQEEDGLSLSQEHDEHHVCSYVLSYRNVSIQFVAYILNFSG